jgi:hypothetical protein
MIDEEPYQWPFERFLAREELPIEVQRGDKLPSVDTMDEGCIYAAVRRMSYM